MRPTSGGSVSNTFEYLNQFYKECSQKNLEMGDAGQSVSQFQAMKGIPPNEQGTGRISFTDVTKIQCLYIGKKRIGTKPNHHKRYLKKVVELLEKYLSMPAIVVDYELEIGESSIQDPTRNLIYTFQRNKSRFNALRILDLLTEYKGKSTLLIAFIESGLHENGSNLYGRACGDGVAVIDFNMMKGNREKVAQFYETLLHETLHTLGFDHCLSWTCLMNPLIAGDLWLCPCCLVKLQSQLPIEIELWAEKVINFYKKEIGWNKTLIQKSDMILSQLKNRKAEKMKTA